MTGIDGNTRVCGLMANPVNHTMSPVLHNLLAEEMRLNIAYVPFLVEEEGLDEAVKGAFSLNLLGINVSVPHKVRVMESLVETDEAALRIGAVNTLVRLEKGFKGYNTDYTGLHRAMVQEGIRIQGEKVLLIGAGGAAKAAAYLLGSREAECVYILNRTLERAEQLAGDMNRVFERDIFIPMRLEDYRDLPKERYLAIQTTKVGMSPHGLEAPISDPDFYEGIHTGVDLIYTPFETRFMTLVRAAGGKALNGLSMLLYQGIEAFELWNGCRVPEELCELAYRRMKEVLE